MSTYYNEINPYAAQWLRNLIAAGHIAKGDVDERSIEEVSPGDVAGYTQCHFFAGIGVWSHALRSAGWHDDRPVWTGSCPCQPFSAAGKKGGFADARHLWPAWFRLIKECKPIVVFGEQVASGDGLTWLDAVHADMEGEDYAVGAADLCAAGVGAPHLRQRLYFVADGNQAEVLEQRSVSDCTSLVGLSDGQRCDGEHAYVRAEGSARRGTQAISEASRTSQVGVTGGFWAPADLIWCRDGKYRAVEPGTFPLAHGIANRVGRLRATGNALVAPVATEFVKAYIGL